MDVNAIATLLKTYGPTIISILGHLPSAFGSATPPPAGGHLAAASPAIAAIQKLLNVLITDQPALVEDGWLGPQTEARIFAGISKLHAAGIG